MTKKTNDKALRIEEEHEGRGGGGCRHLVPARPVGLDGRRSHTDVVRGFDRFFAEQRKQAGDATVTIVQFDDARAPRRARRRPPLAEVALDRRAVRAPRHDPAVRRHRRCCSTAPRAPAAATPPTSSSSILTDGIENASHMWTQKKLFERIGALRDRRAGRSCSSAPTRTATRRAPGLVDGGRQREQLPSRRGRHRRGRTPASAARSANGVASSATNAVGTSTTSGPARRRPSRCDHAALIGGVTSRRRLTTTMVAAASAMW